MTFSRPRVPLGLPIAAVVLFVMGLAAGPYIQANVPEDELAANVLLNAVPFILIFVAIILLFMTLVWAASSALSGNIPRRIYRPVELALMGGIVLGIVGMFQPWVQAFFRGGFYLLLISTLGFIVWSHIRPKDVRRQALGSFDVSDFEQREVLGGD